MTTFNQFKANNMPFYIPSTKEYAGLPLSELLAIAHKMDARLRDEPNNSRLMADFVSIWTLVQVRRDHRKMQAQRLARGEKYRGKSKPMKRKDYASTQDITLKAVTTQLIQR